MTLRPVVCTTCGDRAVTATVVTVEGAQAVVSVDGRLTPVAIDLVPGVAPGDVVLCHASVALVRLEDGT